jgi:hypothetical protein
MVTALAGAHAGGHFPRSAGNLSTEVPIMDYALEHKPCVWWRLESGYSHYQGRASAIHAAGPGGKTVCGEIYDGRPGLQAGRRIVRCEKCLSRAKHVVSAEVRASDRRNSARGKITMRQEVAAALARFRAAGGVVRELPAERVAPNLHVEPGGQRWADQAMEVVGMGGD